MNHRASLLFAAVATMALIGGTNFLIDRAAERMVLATRYETSSVTLVTNTPYINLGTTEPVRVLHPGEIFFVHSTFERAVQGHYNITLDLRSVDNFLIIPLLTTQDWLPAGSYERNERFQVPISVMPGHYRITKKIVNFRDGQAYFSTLFILEFTIEARPR